MLWEARKELCAFAWLGACEHAVGTDATDNTTGEIGSSETTQRQIYVGISG